MGVNTNKQTMERILKATRRIEGLPTDAFLPARRRGGIRYFLARIDAFAPLATNRWKYAFTQVGLDSNRDLFETIDGAQETVEGNYAINIHELQNTATGVQGNSVNQSGEDYPDGFEMQPVGGRQNFTVGQFGYDQIGNNVVVQMWTTTDDLGDIVYLFEYSNADDGTCTAPE